MPVIQNPDAGEIIRRQAGLTLAEGYPQMLGSTVQPVMDMTPRFHRIAKVVSNLSTTSSATVTIFTTSATKDTYIDSVQLGIIKDSTCDAATGSVSLRCTIDAANQFLCVLPVLTLTGQEHNVTVVFPKPVLVNRGVGFQLVTPTYTTGNFIRAYSITYHEVQPI